MNQSNELDRVGAAEFESKIESTIVCARSSCGATLHAEPIDGTEIVSILAQRKGWLGLTSGWYCPCCRLPSCEH